MRTKQIPHGQSSAAALPPDLAAPSIDRLICDFVYGRSDGAELMRALYDDVADEELPPRFTEMLKDWRSH